MKPGQRGSSKRGRRQVGSHVPDLFEAVKEAFANAASGEAAEQGKGAPVGAGDDHRPDPVVVSGRSDGEAIGAPVANLEAIEPTDSQPVLHAIEDETAGPGGPNALPARMLNEFVYCRRLFYYEHVDGIFVENADTERGKDLHSRVDAGNGAMAAPSETVHARSVQMGSLQHGITAKMDLVEPGGSDGLVSPVDYKAGSPREGADTLGLWPTDRMQLGLQMLILRENGYNCQSGFIYYRGTKQRVSLDWDADLEAWILAQIREARGLLRSGERPPPLRDSPKCVRCSLAPVCLPDETHLLAETDDERKTPKEDAAAPRRLIAARDDSRALYLNTPGVRIGIADRVLEVRDKTSLLDRVRMTDVHHIGLFGNIQISTQAVHQLCSANIPITYFSMGGWFYGITRGHSLPNVLVRRAQFCAAGRPEVSLAIAARFVAGKIRNSRKMLMRNSLVVPTAAIARLKQAANDALEASSIESLLGIEGAAAATYFSEFAGMIKADDDHLPGLENPTGPLLNFDFRGRNRRPPTDPVNALLSLAYSLLAKDCTVAALAVGLDPWMGLYHQPRPGRPALALDLMEEFRPLVAESAALTAINTRMFGPGGFVKAGNAVNLSPEGRKKFFHAYEQRMNHLIVHPVFDYQVSYRRALELQARILARVLEGEIPHYTPMLTR